MFSLAADEDSAVVLDYRASAVFRLDLPSGVPNSPIPERCEIEQLLDRRV